MNELESPFDGECRTCVYWYESEGWCRARECDMPDWEGCDDYRRDPAFIDEE